MRRIVSWRIVLSSLVLVISGCARVPSPVWPGFSGSIGRTNQGTLTRGQELAHDRSSLRWYREKHSRMWGIPRFVQALERAAGEVARKRPGAVLWVGDLSSRTGGIISGHASHRSGRDVDVLLYMTTLDGAPAHTPGFEPIGSDGLAWDSARGRYLRHDVERTWLFIKALVSDPDARVQFVFVADILKARIIDWAIASGEHPIVVHRAQEVMHQPLRAAPHDDHLHIRTDCAPEERALGCESVGPSRRWHREPTWELEESTMDLIEALASPIRTPSVRRGAPPHTSRRVVSH